METGSWVGLRREDKIYTQCRSGEVENVKHFILTWKADEREVLVKRMEEIIRT